MPSAAQTCSGVKAQLSRLTEITGVSAPPDRAQVLTDFAERLRAALPEGVALSVTLRGSGDNALTVSEAAELFDRIYLPAGEDEAAVRRQLPEGYDPETRLVVTAAEAPAEEKPAKKTAAKKSAKKEEEKAE